MIQPFFDWELKYWCVTITPKDSPPITTELVRYSPEYANNDWNLEPELYEQAKQVCADYILALNIFGRGITYFQTFQPLEET